MSKETAISYIKNNNLIGIKAGIERPNFLEIWMVTVENRIFARSWGLAQNSWYNSFLKTPVGQIKCGDNIFAIDAIVPIDNEAIADKINAAYLAKYNKGQNIKYAQGIVAKQHIERTLEFLIKEQN